MPNRIIKESICISDSIGALQWFEEVLFYRLIVNCDDYGRFDGRIAVIKNRLFPLKETLTLKAVENAINKLARVGLVVLYEFEGKPYLHLPTWNEHQNIRAKRSKYPAPDGSVNTSEIICNHVQADVPVIQSESESKSESKREAHAPARFVPPTVPEVEAYCAEHGYAINAQQFVDFYASKGWKVGNQPMKNWRAAVRTWVQRRKDEASAKRRGMAKAHNHHQRAYTETELAGIGVDLLDEVEPCAPAERSTECPHQL